MTLRTEIENAKAKEFNSAKWSEILGDLRELACTHGFDCEGPWSLVRTAFHGGGTISRHRSATRALEAARGFRSDCTCGCCDVVLSEKVNELKNAEECSSPYSVAR